MSYNNNNGNKKEFSSQNIVIFEKLQIRNGVKLETLLLWLGQLTHPLSQAFNHCEMNLK